MACILRDARGSITQVTADNGRDSKLFESIASLPFIENKEQAAQIYALAEVNGYMQNEALLRDENGEPVLVFLPNTNRNEELLSRGILFETDFNKAFEKDKDGKGIQLGFLEGKNIENINEVYDANTSQSKVLNEVVDKTKAEIVSVNGEKYVAFSAKQFKPLETFYRNQTSKSFSGFIENLLSKGVRFMKLSSGAGQIRLEEKVRDVLDEVTDEKIGEKKYQKFYVDFEDGARAFGTIEDGIANISGINAPKKEGSVIEPQRGTKTYERVISKLKENGIKTISINLQSIDSQKTLESLVEKGVLQNPRGITGGSFNERATTFDIAETAGDGNVGVGRDVDLKGDIEGSTYILKNYKNAKKYHNLKVGDVVKVPIRDVMPAIGIELGNANAKPYTDAPISVNVLSDGTIRITNGHNRFKKALLNGDKEVEINVVKNGGANVYDSWYNRMAIKAVKEGRITAQDAKSIIEKAGLEVPKEIVEQSLEQQLGQKPSPSVQVSTMNSLVEAFQSFEAFKDTVVTTDSTNLKKLIDNGQAEDVDLSIANEQAKNIPLVKDAKGNLLAPNGRKSNLNEVQWRLVRTEAFKSWAGTNILKDANGEPEVFYHGSDTIEEITEFSSLKGNDFNFFSTDFYEATRYTSKNKEGVKPFFLKAQKTFDITKAPQELQDKIYNEIRKDVNFYYDKLDLSKDMEEEMETEFNTKDKFDLIKIVLEKWNSDDWRILETWQIQDIIKAEGYDSFITHESGGVNIALYEQFNNQIKLADGTNTTFSASSNDINFMVEAYHGSPYSFDRFTTEKMGTGEGAQAFGWGLYFTDLESIARNYANKLSIVNDNLKNDLYNIVLDKYSDFEGIDEVILNKFADFSNYQKVVDYFKAQTKKEKERLTILNSGEVNYDTEIWNREDFKSFLEKNIQYSEAIENFLVDSKSSFLNKYLYKVSLHKGKQPSEYTWLEWDKPVSRDIISQLVRNLSSKKEFETNYLVQDELLGRIYYGNDFGKAQEFKNSNQNSRLLIDNPINKININNITGSGLYESIREILSRYAEYNPDAKAKTSAQKETSLLLLENGIDGVKYPAESISRGATSDTARGFNYVVFDENAITIKEKVQFLKTPQGTVYGATYVNENGQQEIYINTERNSKSILMSKIKTGEIEKIC